ncbi:hypothetical protein HYDPIDRAFT_167755 [Hydnomerulius pinastri MD-312]|uniref:Uncharacterized protein n=1 Tax=Hydnomerulius pinastri MD-312 TaxID=994086 RepID=A0A0C9WFR8_9AGAM|nr:hypothetical protein HYDPIDRAFT_167755 [Hydnomerulius pinastri MD-312]
MASNSILIDDRDSGISYSGPLPIVLGGVSEEYDTTTTGLNAGVSAIYYFTASSISVFGTYGPIVDGTPSIGTYQVDDAPAATVTGPNTQTALYRQNFWTSPQLSPLSPGAFHKLVITSFQNTTIWIDYFAYSGERTVSSFLILPGPSSSTSTTPTQSSRPSVNVDAVAGGVAGAAVVMLAVAAALVYLARRRRARRPATSDGAVLRSHVQEEFNSSDSSDNTSQNSSPSFSRVSAPMQYAQPNSYSTIHWQSRPQSLEELGGSLMPMRTYDGGVSLAGGPLEIPPEYQSHYGRPAEFIPLTP